MSRIKNSVNINIFLDEAGKIKQLPVPGRTKMPVLAYLAGKFETGRNYKEKEVNEIISRWHTFGDYFILRRLLIDCGFMGRLPDGTRYWVIENKAQTGDN